jgi:nitrous oxide reductase accessory protein NosL
MKMTVLTILMLGLFFAGCGKSREERPDAKPVQGSAASGTEQSSAHLLRIKPEMLRDIRVTTAKCARAAKTFNSWGNCE